jgi:hypothetical protein
VDDSLQPVPIGVPGELLIGGAGLALRYLNQPGLTAEKIVPDPFSPIPGARLYRTGDRCRWLPNGAIEFLGRQDGQVKIRGHRVELGEIEAALAVLAGVDQAVVVVCEHDQTGAGTQKLLRAYVVPRPGTILDVMDLRRDLARRLPEPMMPGEWLVLESLPLTENGKIDRGSLASAPVVARPAVAPPPGPEKAAIPRTLLELEITRIWQRLFGRDQIPRTTDFFELGDTRSWRRSWWSNSSRCSGVVSRSPRCSARRQSSRSPNSSPGSHGRRPGNRSCRCSPRDPAAHCS